MGELSYSRGFRDGIPIGLGYLSVSFGFAIWGLRQEFPGLFLIALSASNMTSAGQVAGVTIIAAGGSITEIALSQLIINLRYALMSITLSQKLSDRFNTLQRMAASFFITDEIFALASTRLGKLEFPYVIGLGTLPWIGWTLGTALGVFAGTLLPAALCAALGIAIYGMFLAIIVPPMREDRGVLAAVFAAVAAGLTLRYLPVFSFLSEGFVIIISAVFGAVIAALFRPVKPESE